MRKLLYILSLAALIAFMPAAASAQQTREEATDSIKNIMDQARNGDATAQNEVGRWYYEGRHVDQNYDEAFKWWGRSAKQGNVQAIGNMGLCYQTGHGVEADSLMASKLYLRSIKDGNEVLLKRNLELAGKGNVFSSMLMAECYTKGIGVDKDKAKAVPYLTTAAEKNSVIAQRDLGLLMLNDKKAQEAARWFGLGAKQGDLTCIFYTGKMLLEGLGVKKNAKEGADMLLKAAEGGFPQAMYYVGNCYHNGNGLTRNAEQAVKWYKLAAGKGVSHAQWALAQAYRTGDGIPVSYAMALQWYAEASANGYKRSFKNLVSDSIPGAPFVAFAKGMKAYMRKDFTAAMDEFKAVEKAKVVDGKVMQGAVLCNSSYPGNNVKKGVKLLKEAAATSPQAMYLLAGLSEAGKGMPKDMAVAIDYLTKAAGEDYGPAECALGDMYYEGRGVEKNYEKAVELYGRAFAQGQLTETAARRYATCYEEGHGVEADKEKAAQIKKSARGDRMVDLLSIF